MARIKLLTKKCKNCTIEYHFKEKHQHKIGYEYCLRCRTYHKNCEVCGKETFNQGRTCSKECAYELRKVSWRKSCGSEHNFSKKSSSRKKWESILKEKEGIDNVFQREKVKEKIKNTIKKRYGVNNISQNKKIKAKKSKTCMENYGVSHGWNLTEKVNDTMISIYGQSRVTNPEKISKNRREILRPKMEKLGIWIPLADLSEYELYKYNVWAISKSQIRMYGDLINSEILKENINITTYKNKWSIDHKYSIKQGFLSKISPSIIGSIVNLEILTVTENSKKQANCSISFQKLLKLYNKHYENTKDREN